jgi:hypothetical protein
MAAIHGTIHLSSELGISGLLQTKAAKDGFSKTTLQKGFYKTILQKDFSETNFWPDLFKTRFYQSYFTDPTDCEEKGGGGG